MKNENIEWRKVDENYGLYEVSSKGDVRNSTTGKILKPCDNSNGYFYAHLYKNRQRKAVGIHRLAAFAFIENPNDLPEVNHLNGDKHDNRIENLEWCSPGENKSHCYRVLGRHFFVKQNAKSTIHNGNAKINSLDKIQKVFELKKSGLTTKEIAAIFSVHQTTIQRILSKKSFKDIST